MKRIKNYRLKKALAKTLEFFGQRLLALEHKDNRSVLFVYSYRVKHWFPLQFQQTISFWTALGYYFKNRQDIEQGIKDLSTKKIKMDERISRMIATNLRKRKRR